MSRIRISESNALISTEYVQVERATSDDIVVVAAHEGRMISQVERVGEAASPEGARYSATKGRHAIGWLDSERATGGWYEGSSEDWTMQIVDGRLHTTDRDPQTGERQLLAAVRAGNLAIDGFAVISIGMAFPSETEGEPGIFVPEVFVPVDTTLHSQGSYWQAADGKFNGIPIYRPTASGYLPLASGSAV